MDRSIEPQVPLQEMQIQVRMSDQVGSARAWVPPVPLRVRFTGFRDLGLSAPCKPKPGAKCATLRVDGLSHLVTSADGRHWLAVTAPLGEPSELVLEAGDARAVTTGGPCKTLFTMSRKGLIYMAYADIGRPALQRMTDAVLSENPRSSVATRLLPRYAVGVIRHYPGPDAVEFWVAI